MKKGSNSNKKIILVAILLSLFIIGGALSVVLVLAATSQNVTTRLKISYSVDGIAAYVSSSYAVVPRTGTITKVPMTIGGSEGTEFRVDENTRTAEFIQTDNDIRLSSASKKVVYEFYIRNDAGTMFEISLNNQIEADNMTVRYKTSRRQLDTVEYRNAFDNEDFYTLPILETQGNDREVYIYMSVEVTNTNYSADYEGSLTWSLTKVDDNAPNLATITLSNDGGTGGASSMKILTAYNGNDYAMPMVYSLPTKSGSAFDGYYAEGMTNKYVDCDGSSDRVCNLSNGNTLFAKFNDSPFTLDGSKLVSIDNSLKQQTEISIPENVTEIADGVFENCTQLVEVDFESVYARGYASRAFTKIGNNAFKNCVNLQVVNVPSTLTTLGNGAFAGCRSLTELTIPFSGDIATYFGSDSTTNSYTVSGKYIPNSLTKLIILRNSGSSLGLGTDQSLSCLRNYTNLRTVELGNEVTIIGDSDFGSCTQLTSVIISNSVTEIGDNAFINCSGLQNLIIPDSVSSIGINAFLNCTGNVKVSLSNYARLLGYYGTGTTKTATVAEVEAQVLKLLDEDSGYVDIRSVEEFAAFRDYVDYGHNLRGKTVRLFTDIDLTQIIGYETTKWIPIGISDASTNISWGFASDSRFSGTFDGGNHTISGIDFTANHKYVALFCFVDGAIIKNFTVEGQYTYGGNNAAGVVGKMYSGTIQNVVSNIEVASTTFADGWVKGKTGGIVCFIDKAGNGDVVIRNCVNKGNVVLRASGLGTGSWDMPAGGIVGYISSPTYKVSIIDCVNEGDINSTLAAGGIVGLIQTGEVEISGCVNKGNITATELPNDGYSESADINYSKQLRQSAGGILGLINYQASLNSVGYFKIDVEIDGCSNESSVDAKYCGGIVGLYTNDRIINAGKFPTNVASTKNMLTITNCENKVNLDQNAKIGYTDDSLISVYQAGGIVGMMYNSQTYEEYTTYCLDSNSQINYRLIEANLCKMKIENCLNQMDVRAGCFAGGIVGVESTNFTTYKTNPAHISNDRFLAKTTEIKNCEVQNSSITTTHLGVASPVSGKFESSFAAGTIIGATKGGYNESTLTDYCANSIGYLGCGCFELTGVYTKILNDINSMKGKQLSDSTISSVVTNTYGTGSVKQLNGNVELTINKSYNGQTLIPRPFNIEKIGTNVTITIIDNDLLEYEGALADSKYNDMTSLTIVVNGGGSCPRIFDLVGQQNIGGITNVVINGATSLDTNLFLNCSNVQNVTIGNSVTSIPTALLSGKTSLKTVSIGNGVISIGNSAFDGCTALTSVTFGNHVQSIGAYSFNNCTSLGNVSLPSSLRTIGQWAFNSCMSFTNLVLPNGLTTISYGSINNCTNLVSLTVPISLQTTALSTDQYAINACGKLTSLTISGSGALTSACFNCLDRRTGTNNKLNSQITNIVIGNDVTSIANGLFSNRTVLKTVSIGNGVISIGGSAFDGCTALTSVTFGNHVESIGSYGFNNCTSLGNVSLPSSLKTIGQWAFSSCKSFTNLVLPNGLTTISYGSINNCTNLVSLTVPISLQTTVLDNESYAINACGNLTNLTISGSGAFSKNWLGCLDRRYNQYNLLLRQITNLTIADSVTGYISDTAFVSFSNLTDVTIGNGITSISYSAFEGISSLTNLVIGNSVTNIGMYVFRNCTGLTNVTIGNSIQYIADNAFDSCYNMSYNISGNAKYIGNNTNPYVVLMKPSNTNITSCTINSNTKIIYSYALADCRQLSNLTIPSSVVSIGTNAFQNCSGLISVTLNNNANIDGQMFAGCSNIETFNVNASNTKCKFENNCLLSMDGKTLLVGCKNPTISSTVTSIGNSAFSGRGSLTSITIPNSVKTIGMGVFAGCVNLTSVTIPSSVTEIDARAFYGCSNLNYVYFNNTVGWMRDGSPIDVSNASSNAYNLKGLNYMGEWYYSKLTRN